jgi:hypothetical protein
MVNGSPHTKSIPAKNLGLLPAKKIDESLVVEYTPGMTTYMEGFT